MRLITFLFTAALAFALVLDGESVLAQGLGLPPGTNQPVPKQSLPSTAPTPPSMQNQNFAARPASGQSGGGQLPRAAGQEHRIYDLRPYTGYLTNKDRPEQAIVDWILRETGSDVWFTEPFGFMNANRDSLSVYHTNEMHQVIASLVDRFVAGEKDPQVLNLRVMRVGSPNWRSRAHMLMQHVNVDSPGVQAWLLSKENAAMVLNQLRQRTDARQTHDMNMIVHNGQTERVVNIRGRNYVRSFRPSATGWPPYEPETGEIQEGYKLAISPLLTTDGNIIDCVIEADIDQVDKLNPVDLELPLPNNEVFRGRIDVPQVVSWRLKERFRWPADMVLLLSCGVVAHPESQPTTIPLLNMELNMDMLTGGTSGRADALLFIQFRGRASENLTHHPQQPVPQMAVSPGGATRGRY